MIRIDEVRDFPVEIISHLTEDGLADMRSVSAQLSAVAREQRLIVAVYEDDVPLCIGGVRKSSMLGNVMIWFIPCVNFRSRHARRARSVLEMWRRQYGTLRTYVRGKRACRFAEFMGLVPTSCTYEDYTMYEMRA